MFRIKINDLVGIKPFAFLWKNDDSCKCLHVYGALKCSYYMLTQNYSKSVLGYDGKFYNLTT